MKREQGFSLIELLIVVAIIAIIAAIAVPSMLQARMAANESGAIQGCRTIGSAEVAFSAINNQSYTDGATLMDRGFLDSRFDGGFNGYDYAIGSEAVSDLVVTLTDSFGATAEPKSEATGRYTYGIASDQIVRYLGTNSEAMKCGESDCEVGAPIGTTGGSGS
ncbi:MAG: prepilin-type N-terminal cleavage/methylation domain-containing protein [Acidobacteria bacterium]|nr:prepilin-type N-terminal cleavage/methylation domain-containing protein [Acidobacteriota bacterium]